MAQPIWVSPVGSLGTIPEGVFYSTPLLAYEPSAETVYFEIISGNLPPGVQCEATGLIVGVPLAIASVQGVPLNVSADVTSKFVVRAYTKKINGTVDRLADRTFTLTVTGQDAPEFITEAGNIAIYYDGTLVPGLQIQYTDYDPADVVEVRLVTGSLPPGLTISLTGLISGFVQPIIPTDERFTFILEVTDGKSSSLRSFNIQVYNRASMSADNTFITSDNTFITADASPIRTPIITNPLGSIGTVRNDNFFAYQFIGLDLDGDPFSFTIDSAPPGLVLDSKTGWLYGYIPDLGQVELTYNFIVRVFKDADPTVISGPYNYSLTTVGTADTAVTWLVPSDLGTINNGATSTLYVLAESPSLYPLYYRLESGSDSSLPQGLTLLSDGSIAGRVSFDTFSLDGGLTTFDVNQRSGETTFDLTFTFTVNAYSTNGVISVYKTFTIHVNREYNKPFNNLYIQAMPPFNDRTLVNSLLDNTLIIPRDLLYRPTDPNFGLASDVIYQHAFGLNATTLDTYVSSLYLNHYWKNLTLGSIETAQALDADGNIVYEVVYSRIVDNLVNNDNTSVSKEIRLPYTIPGNISTAYPNSLADMRDQVIDVVGQISNILPLWMLSKQTDGRVLGFTPAWVIAYTKPGKSKQIQYNIEQQFGTQLNQVDFKADRYELDCKLSVNWNPIGTYVSGDLTVGPGIWEPVATETTFDIDAHYTVTSIATGGSGYAIGDRILILGSNVGGEDTVNNIILIVNTVNTLTGAVISAFYSGQAPSGNEGYTYTNISGTNIIGTGIGATWNFTVVPGFATVFDGDSLKFIAPVDMYNNLNVYDKYLIFPKRNILE